MAHCKLKLVQHRLEIDSLARQLNGRSVRCDVSLQLGKAKGQTG